MIERRNTIINTVLATAFVTGLALPHETTATPNSPVTPDMHFSQTGYDVNNLFAVAYNEHGGMKLIGLPISKPFSEKAEDGKDYITEYFERGVMELHPENAAPYNVLMKRVGVEAFNQKYAGKQPVETPNTSSGSIYFPQTGHRLGGEFEQAWKNDGETYNLGLPISDEMQEVSAEDGKTYTVQYFERGVAEFHPENQGDQRVQFSRLGEQRLMQLYPDIVEKNSRYNNLPKGDGVMIGFSQMQNVHNREIANMDMLEKLPTNYYDYSVAPLIDIPNHRHLPMAWDNLSVDEVRKDPGKAWILGNEPLNQYQQNKSPKEYADFYVNNANVIRQADPSAAIIMAGLDDARAETPPDKLDNGDPVRYLNDFMNEIEHRIASGQISSDLLPDALNAHLYIEKQGRNPLDSNAALAQLDSLIAVAKQHPSFANIPWIVGEYGEPNWIKWPAYKQYNDPVKIRDFENSLRAGFKQREEVVSAFKFTADSQDTPWNGAGDLFMVDTRTGRYSLSCLGYALLGVNVPNSQCW